MVTDEEFEFMEFCVKNVNANNYVSKKNLDKAIEIAERIIYKNEICSKTLDGVEKRTILVVLNSARERLR
ncbi:hypothetical protein SAMN02910377_00947 [Pseudobutyrivibrio ruminis]|uniref:Uncharacterized protein n=1 Tax=Pseudobutyrivibrio ruminis TaxID=46206 RepID=A0A1H7H735_9FIRM|nr:hypothetical protein [Pseudobutyrivibrio ruminis]SEK46048.1 hypothetical protein SAMN02910377_00947 [Pseudobutyrivibrio ruminis]